MKLYLQSRAILDFRVLRFVLHCLMSIIQKSRLNHMSKFRADARPSASQVEPDGGPIRGLGLNQRGHDFAYRKRSRRSKGGCIKFKKLRWPLQRKYHFKIELCGRLCVLSSAQVMCSVRSPSDRTSIYHTSPWNQPLSE